MPDPLLRILGETRIDIDEARRRLGTDGKPIHYATVYRMMNRGLETPGGGRAVLEHLRVGGKLITSVEAIARFVAATNGIDPDDTEDPSAPSVRRARELSRVDRELEARGLGAAGDDPGRTPARRKATAAGSR
jgi:hypothetical protein